MSFNSPPSTGLKPLKDDGRFQDVWSGWFRSVWKVMNSGFSGTVVTAKLTGGGTNGSMTFENGRVTESIPAT